MSARRPFPPAGEAPRLQISAPFVRLVLMLAMLLMAGAITVSAQPAGENGTAFEIRAAGWTQMLDNLARELDRSTLDDAALAQAHERLQTLLTESAQIVSQAGLEAERIRGLLDTLGPPPDTGTSYESPTVAAERARLREQLVRVEARGKQAELLAARARQQIGRITQARRRLLTEALLERGPSPLRPALLARAWRDLVGILDAVRTAPFDAWFPQPPEARLSEERERGLLIAAGWALLLWFGARMRRRLLRRHLRDRAVTQPSCGDKVRAALAVAVARGVVPAVIAGVPLLLGLADSSLSGLFADMLVGALGGALLGTAVYAIGRAVLAPYSPAAWRLPALSDAAARKVFRRTIALAGILGVAFFIEYVTTRRFDVSIELAIAYHFVVDTAIAVYLLLLAHPDLWREESPRETTPEAGRTVGARREPLSFWVVVRSLVLFAAPTIPVSAALGYNALATFLATNIAFSMMLVCVLMLLHRLAHDIAALALSTQTAASTDTPPATPDRGTGLLHFWLMAAVDIVLFVVAVLVLLPLWGMPWQDMKDMLLRAAGGIRIGSFTLNLTDLLLAVVLFAVILLVTRALQRMLEERVFPQTRLDTGVRHSIKTATGYVGLVLAGGVAVSTIGLNLSELAIVLGALSVGIGFGLQAIVNNFVSGLILLIERPVKVGDWVVVGPHQGYVKRIKVRATELETFQRASVIIPNSELISASLINWTHKDTYARVEVAMGVEHGTDVARLRELLLACAQAHPRVVGWPEPAVLFMRLGPDSLDFELRVFIAQADYMVIVASELRYAILESFQQHGIRLAHAQMDVHLAHAGAAPRPPEESGSAS